MHVTVYCGASYGGDERYTHAAKQLGRYLGIHGHTLVYGGGASGLMGVIATQVKCHGGHVIGVRPIFIAAYETPEDHVTTLIVDDMKERKEKMMALSDVWIAMPGGVGTLDEISDVMSLLRLKRLKGACILFNVHGYYDSLKAFLWHMLQEGFVDEEAFKQIHFASTLDEIHDLIAGSKKVV